MANRIKSVQASAKCKMIEIIISLSVAFAIINFLSFLKTNFSLRTHPTLKLNFNP